MKVAEMNSILQALQTGEGITSKGDLEATSFGLQVNSKDTYWRVALSAGKTRKCYSDIVEDRRSGNVPHVNKMHKLFVKSKHHQSAEYNKTLLKPMTQLKVAISAPKTLKNSQIIIESDRKSKLEEVCKKINEACGEELESYMPTLKNPRIIVLNIPEDITLRMQHKL
jgi:2,3-bisphosphoglycerate-independent phosphoglycerate mutase